MLDMKVLETLKEELEGWEKEKLRAEERLKHHMAELKKLGFTTVEDAEAGIVDLTARIERLESKLESDYNTFMDNYEELFGDNNES